MGRWRLHRWNAPASQSSQRCRLIQLLHLGYQPEPRAFPPDIFIKYKQFQCCTKYSYKSSPLLWRHYIPKQIRYYLDKVAGELLGEYGRLADEFEWSDVNGKKKSRSSWNTVLCSKSTSPNFCVTGVAGVTLVYSLCGKRIRPLNWLHQNWLKRFTNLPTPYGLSILKVYSTAWVPGPPLFFLYHRSSILLSFVLLLSSASLLLLSPSLHFEF